MCQTYDLAFIPWAPLSAGGLTGKYKRIAQQATGTRFGDETDPGKLKRFSDGVMDIADGLEPIANAHNATVAQIALVWVAAQPGVTAPIAGPRTLEQFIDNLSRRQANSRRFRQYRRTSPTRNKRCRLLRSQLQTQRSPFLINHRQIHQRTTALFLLSGEKARLRENTIEAT